MEKTSMKSNKSRWSKFYNKYATQITMVGVIIVLGIILSIASPYFFRLSNFINIGIAISVSGTMAAGLTVVMLMGEMDLSQYSAMAMIAMIAAVMMSRGVSPWVALIVSILLGIGVGLVNAFIVNCMHIASMIGSIAMMLICRAGAYLANNGQYQNITNSVYETIGFGRIVGLPILIIIMAIVFLILGYILRNTAFGRQVYAVGGNSVAAELSGVNIQKMKLMGFIISGASAGLAAILESSQVGCAMPTAGAGSEMDGIAAVFLGGVAFTGGKGYMVGSFIGVLLLQVLTNGMTLLNVQPYFQQLLKGIVLLIAVYSDVVRTRRAKAQK